MFLSDKYGNDHTFMYVCMYYCMNLMCVLSVLVRAWLYEEDWPIYKLLKQVDSFEFYSYYMIKVNTRPSRVNPGLTQKTLENLENGGYEAQAAQKKNDFHFIQFFLEGHPLAEAGLQGALN